MAVQKWWSADKADLLSLISRDVDALETQQMDGYERFYKLAWLYDPLDYLGQIYQPNTRRPPVTENICASAVDTVTSMIAKQRTRPVFLTDEGTFKTKRQAADLGRYAEALAKLVRLDERKARIFKDGATFGTGLLRWEIDAEGCISHERFLPVEVRINEQECLTQLPKSMHLLKFRDRDLLMARYPKNKDELANEANTAGNFWFGRLSTDESDQLLVRESYRLPTGKPGTPGYQPGRKVISTSQTILVDEEYDFPRFPVAVLRWSERTTGFMGKGLIEDLMGHQATINRQNLAMDAQIDAHASPIIYVNTADATLMHKASAVAGVGRFIPYTVEKPSTDIPKVIAQEVMQRQEYLKRSYLEMSGISTMHSHGELQMKRAETGAAVQELNEVSSERFSIQEQAAERWYLDCIEVMLMLIRGNADKGLKTPEMPYSFAGINKRIKWSEVDLKDVTYQLQAAPQFSRTLSGRYQQISDWANQGMISPDEARHLLHHPDLDSAMSLYDAYREYIDKVKELLLDGEFVSPDPRENLAMGLNWMTMAYFEALNDNAPEERVENIRTWCDQAVFLLNKAQPPAPPAGLAPPLPQAA